MGQILSFLLPSLFSKELELVLQQQIDAKCNNITSLKLNATHLLATGSSFGVVLVYDLSDVSAEPLSCILTFEYGGVSTLCWIADDKLVVGTSRGRIVVYSLDNEMKRLVEICSMKAHGDGASQVEVQSLDYCAKTRCLVSVAEGKCSTRLWDVAEKGNLQSRKMAPDMTSYCTPRFVTFTENGSKVVIGFLQNAIIQTFQLESMKLLDECVLMQSNGDDGQRWLGDAILLEAIGSIAIFNLKDGLDIYDLLTLTKKHSAKFTIDGRTQSQAIAPLRSGCYLATPSAHGRVEIFHAQDAMRVLRLRVPGRNNEIEAIHAAPQVNGEVLVTSSYRGPAKPNQLTVWRPKGSQQNNHNADYSTLRVVLLCAIVSSLCHFAVSVMPTAGQMLSLLAAGHIPLSTPAGLGDTSFTSPNVPGVEINSAELFSAQDPTAASAAPTRGMAWF